MLKCPPYLKKLLDAHPKPLTWESLKPNRTMKCQWKSEHGKQPSPHYHKPFKYFFNSNLNFGKLNCIALNFDFRWTNHKIMASPLDAIGQTPLIQVGRLSAEEGVHCQLLAKCEALNIAGSVKDRIAKRMVEDAERLGLLNQGGCIIENTGGNTGIGLAYIASVKGYKCIIALTDKFSQEKEDALLAHGADVIRTNSQLAFDHPDSDFGVAVRLSEIIPNSCYIGQFQNLHNPLTHYDNTAEELLYQCDGQVDMFVCGAGSGGTLTGVGRKLKEKCPNVKIIGADPVGSIVAYPDSLNEPGKGNQYEVEGMGRPFIPLTCDRQLADKWYKVSDDDGFNTAKRLVQEGILCGGSSGHIMWAAIQASKEFLVPGQKCVVMLPDSMKNYMSKFMDDDWMRERGWLHH